MKDAFLTFLHLIVNFIFGALSYLIIIQAFPGIPAIVLMNLFVSIYTLRATRMLGAKGLRWFPVMVAIMESLGAGVLEAAFYTNFGAGMQTSAYSLILPLALLAILLLTKETLELFFLGLVLAAMLIAQDALHRLLFEAQLIGTLTIVMLFGTIVLTSLILRKLVHILRLQSLFALPAMVTVWIYLFYMKDAKAINLLNNASVVWAALTLNIFAIWKFRTSSKIPKQ